MPRMRQPRPSPDARAGCKRQARSLCDLAKRKAVELRRDLALEPRAIAPGAWIVASPLMVAQLRLGNGAGALPPSLRASAWIGACERLRRQRLACHGDRAQPALPARLRQARLAVPAPPLTWGTPASILAGLALSVFICSLYVIGYINASLHRKAYERYSESSPTYTFTNEQILVARRYVQSSIAWQAVDRALETKTAYVLIVGLSFVCVPRRNIPAHNLYDFIQLRRTHHLLGE